MGSVAAKRNGWFERQLIVRSSPRLAVSARGFDFASGPRLRHRLKTAVKVHSPIRWRATRRRLMRDRERPYYQSEPFTRFRFGPRPLLVEQFVDLDSLQDLLCVSRALTIERLLRDEL